MASNILTKNLLVMAWFQAMLETSLEIHWGVLVLLLLWTDPSGRNCQMEAIQEFCGDYLTVDGEFQFSSSLSLIYFAQLCVNVRQTQGTSVENTNTLWEN